MPFEVFRDAEQRYLDWLDANEHGYVLSVHDVQNGYMAVHRSACYTMSRYSERMDRNNSFTGREYYKVCSDHVSDLLRWALNEGRKWDPHFCKICDPALDEVEEFEEKVARSLHDSDDARLNRLAAAPRHPKRRTIEVTVFDRNPDVVAEVLKRANGVCEKCDSDAPFLRAKDGRPYLEVHHVITLADGGEDSVGNALACCPNCHRKAHYG